jgi:predicted nucleic acid-binding protein
VYYGFIQKYGTVEAADEIMRNVNGLPIEVITTISNAMYHETARYKAGYSISLADAFLCATAKSLSATIVTKDGEIKPVEQAENLSVFWIK